MINLNCCQIGAMDRPLYWQLERYAYMGGVAALTLMVAQLEPRCVRRTRKGVRS